MRTRQPSEAELAARDAGADTAEVIIRAQIEAGVPLHHIGLSAQPALTAWFGGATPAATAFSQGYA